MSPARRPVGPGNSLVLRVDRDVASRSGSYSCRPKRFTSTPAATRRVDHDSGAQRAVSPPCRSVTRSVTASSVEDRVEEPVLLEHPGAALLGVTEQDLVEALPQDLKRLRRGRFQGGREIGVALVRSVRRRGSSRPTSRRSRTPRSCHARPGRGGSRWSTAAAIRRCGSAGTARAPARRRSGPAAPAPWRWWSRRAPSDDRHVVVPPAHTAPLAIGASCHGSGLPIGLPFAPVGRDGLGLPIRPRGGLSTSAPTSTCTPSRRRPSSASTTRRSTSW